jgi:hypothetical protein
MSTTRTSWEIVLAGFAFIGIGIYLYNQGSPENKKTVPTVQSPSSVPQTPSPSNLPGSIVIDLDNLQSLKQLKELHNFKNPENLKNLEIELKNLDKIIEKYAQQDIVKESLDQSLQQLEAELQKIENADFKVNIQDQKVYINKDYNVDEAKWTEVSPGVFVFREQFPISNLESMDLKLGFGNLNIIGSEDNQAEVTLKATGKLEDPAKFSEQLSIEKDLSGPKTTYRVAPARESSISNQINLDATLKIPKNLKIITSTSGGHINASNMNRDQHFQTSGGHISLNSLEGKTVAETDGGHITVNQISGNTSVSTGGGHIKVNDTDGSLAAETGGGHIEIENASGRITAKTSGGNISASVQQAEGPIKLITSAGNISLNLPQDVAANLDISGSSVNISEVFDFSGTKNKGNISGYINGGGLSVVVDCEYGNVNINSN